ncbi:MAG: zinc-ribbon and DUF3426 domain-containing protein [Aquabacterium sp.]
MSLATRCTHCGTIFKVVQDQLKVSEGWVRCGRCQEVFNALPSLFDLEKDPPPPRMAPAAPRHEPGSPIPISAMPDVRPAAPPPSPAAQPDPLVEQGLLNEADVDLGFDSKPPDAWARTQPADIASHTLDEDDLALDPAPIEATTDFELDTSIAVDDDTPLEAVLASVAPRRPSPAPEAPETSTPATPATPAAPAVFAAEPSPAAGDRAHQAEDLSLRITPSPRPWLDEPPEDLPTTEEEDALDSRYLMPSPTRDRKPPRRLEEGPEFVDAQFPSDAFIDAEEDWASDFGPSALDADAPAPAGNPLPADAAAAAPVEGLRSTPGRARIDTATAPEPQREQEDAQEDAEPGDAAPAASKLRGKKRGKDAHEPEFVRRAQRRAFWRHPATRAVLSLTAVTLLAALGLQMAHQFRDLIAAHHPASRPWLERWCTVAHCEIKPPLHIEDLQVESATLVRAASEGPDSYRLAVVVHNRAGIELAWPHIDLTLTDDNGAVIARRVFAPDDAQWLDTADPKAETPATQPDEGARKRPVAVPRERSTTLQWRLLAPDIKPAGYTAELFYP